MDLLRLVLSRQTNIGARRLQRLSKSASFWRVRQTVIPAELGFEIRMLNRELISMPLVYAALHRAAFLHDEERFECFAEKIGRRPFDLWYCLSTGNRRIQEVAIAVLRQSFDTEDMLMSLNDPGNFPWTPWLDEQIRELIEERWKKVGWYNPNVTSILGAILITDVTRIPTGGKRYLQYMRNLVRRILRGEDSWERNDIIERMIESCPKDINSSYLRVILMFSGYLYRSEGVGEEYFSNCSLSCPSHEVLCRMSKSGAVVDIKSWKLIDNLYDNQALTKRDVLQARACLDDPVTRAALGDEALEVYKLIALEVESRCNSSIARKITGVPTHGDVACDSTNLALKSCSVQGWQMVDPVWSARIVDPGIRVIQAVVVEIANIRGRLVYS